MTSTTTINWRTPAVVLLCGGMALALIGLFNVFGSYFWGWLGGHYTKKFVRPAAKAALIRMALT